MKIRGRFRGKRKIWDQEWDLSPVSADGHWDFGNVWKFPYMAGKYGGGGIYFDLSGISGTSGSAGAWCEFAVGRGGCKSTARDS